MAQFTEAGDSRLPHGSSASERRGFLAAAVAIGVGGLAYLSPLAAGIVPFLNPLRQKGTAGEFLRLAALENLPEDGTPQKIAVVADHTDAWNRFPEEPIGAVFLRRIATAKVQALGRGMSPCGLPCRLRCHEQGVSLSLPSGPLRC